MCEGFSYDDLENLISELQILSDSAYEKELNEEPYDPERLRKRTAWSMPSWNDILEAFNKLTIR